MTDQQGLTWTFLNFSSCLKVSGSSSVDTFFIHMRAPLYSVLTFSMWATVSLNNSEDNPRKLDAVQAD